MTPVALTLVALGSALGGVCRFVVSALVKGGGGFPWATFAVNVAGSLLIGVLSGALARCGGAHAALWRAFAVVGFCGGFTTFSTFSNDSYRLLENGQYALLSLSVVSSVLAGFGAVVLGWTLSRL